MPDKLRLRNRLSDKIRIVIEPWGREYTMSSGAYIEIVALGNVDQDLIELEQSDYGIIVHAWSLDISVSFDGETVVLGS